MTFDISHFVGAKVVWCAIVVYIVSSFVSGLVVNGLSGVPNCSRYRYNCDYDVIMNFVIAGIFCDMGGILISLYFTVRAFIRVLEQHVVMLFVGLMWGIAEGIFFVFSLDIYANMELGCGICIRKTSYLFDFFVFRLMVGLFVIVLLFVIMMYRLLVCFMLRCRGGNSNHYFIV